MEASWHLIKCQTLRSTFRIFLSFLSPSLSLILFIEREWVWGRAGGGAFEKQAYFCLEKEQAALMCGLTQALSRTPHPPGLVYFVRLSRFLFHIDFKV